MKYALPYYRGCRIQSKVDEIIIKYFERDGELIHFAQSLPKKQRLIINVTGLEFTSLEDKADNIKIFHATFKVKHNIAFLVSYEQKSLWAELDDYEIPYFFIEPARNLTSFEQITNYHVSDIYITDELGFYLSAISPKCKKLGIQIRVFPNVCQAEASVKSTNDIVSFFIRPEDTYIYENYVDVFEFYGPLDKQPVLYEIYKSRVWNGQLEDLILGMHSPVRNTTLIPGIGNWRVCCKRRCAYDDSCHICNTILIDLAQTLEEKGIEIYSQRIENEELQINEKFMSDDTASTSEDAV